MSWMFLQSRYKYYSLKSFKSIGMHAVLATIVDGAFRQRLSVQMSDISLHCSFPNSRRRSAAALQYWYLHD